MPGFFPQNQACRKDDTHKKSIQESPLPKREKLGSAVTLQMNKQPIVGANMIYFY